VASRLAAAAARVPRDAAYLALGALLGGVWLLALALGAVVLLVLLGGLVGAPVAAWVLETVRRAGELERRQANRLLRIDVAAPAPVARAAGARARLHALATAGSTWRAIAWLVLRQPLALLAATAVWAIAWYALSLSLAPFTGALVGAGQAFRVAALVGAAALVLLIAQSLWLSSALHARLAAVLLGPSARDEVASLRTQAAELDLRAGLARDLHDSVGHSVTASLLQASAARLALARDPEFAAGALEAIEAQSRGALEELDRVLGALRSGRADVAVGGTLDSIDELLGRARTAGVALTLERRGDLAHVPPEISREAFRIVQEGLTNVLRHASGARTRVVLARTGSTLEIVVENGAGSALDEARAGGGAGLGGIADRVGPLDGSIAYGPLPDGGFRLCVALPFGAA
jgi:signal transduction histidine kinase